MSTLLPLLSAAGAMLSSLEDERALLAALDRLDGASKAVRTELEARLAPPAPAMPPDCSAGHSWQISHGRSATSGKLLTFRRCVVCDATEEAEYSPPAYRRGAAR